MNKTIQRKSDIKHRAEISRITVEVLEDPDFGKKLSDKARKRLSSVSDKELSEAISLSRIK